MRRLGVSEGASLMNSAAAGDRLRVGLLDGGTMILRGLDVQEGEDLVD